MDLIKKHKNIILFALIVLLIIPIYWPILSEIFRKIIHREESSYGLIIPFISLYFIWLKRSRLREIEKRFDPVIGLITVGMGTCLYFLEIAKERFYFQSFSFIIIISGLLIMCMGKDVFKELSFPVLLLISLLPLPPGFYLGLAKILREINLRGALWITSILNITFLRENLLVHFHNTTLSINIGCSGIRYFLSYLIFGIVYAYMFRKGFIDRTLLVLFTIPLSILAGTLRLTAIFLSVYFIGPFMGEYVPHLILSWAVFLIIGAALIFLDQFILYQRTLRKAR